MGATSWPAAVAAAWAAGRAAAPPPARVPLADADRLTLAEPLVARTDIPAFPTSSVDGWAVRGPGPWRVAGQVLAGGTPPPLTADGDCVEIATGAMVPVGTTEIVRVENSTVGADGRVSGTPRERPDWRQTGEEAAAGEELIPAGTPITPGLIGLAAACGHDDLAVRPPPRAAVLVFGDELLTAGLPGAGRVRDALGPQLPAWLRRLGVTVDGASSGGPGFRSGDGATSGGPGFRSGDGATSGGPGFRSGYGATSGDLAGGRPAGPSGEPGVDTLAAHVDGIAAAVDKGADLICTTGGTMRGPVDHLHPALAELGATFVADTVAVRPGFPMLLARVPAPGGRTALVAGLPGNPQSAVIAVVTLVAPLVAGWLGRPEPRLTSYPRMVLGAPVAGRGSDTHLALVRRDPADGLAYPLSHAGSAMLRGLAQAVGFAVVGPGVAAAAGDEVPLLPLPLIPGEVP